MRKLLYSFQGLAIQIEKQLNIFINYKIICEFELEMLRKKKKYSFNTFR